MSLFNAFHSPPLGSRGHRVIQHNCGSKMSKKVTCVTQVVKPCTELKVPTSRVPLTDFVVGRQSGIIAMSRFCSAETNSG